MANSDFLTDGVTAADISGWAELLPERPRLVGASLFADFFVMDGDGAIHMLEVSAACIRKIARSEDEFRERCIDDPEGWLLRPLVNRCVSAGKVLTPAQCYAFTRLPLFGGKYEVDNVWICSWSEWIGYTASVYSQTKHLPDGAKVSVSVQKPN
jgi:hypothetical protein